MSHRDIYQCLDAVGFVRERLGISPDAKQAEVLTREMHRGVLNCARQWGKSTIAAAKAVHRACFRPESLTIVVSPSARQSGEFLRKAAGFVRRLDMRVRGDGDNDISLLFPNGARIVGLPGMECKVRGFSAVSLMLIDEAARVDDDMYKSLRPMLAVGGGDLLLMSTPRGKRGFFWDAWAKGGSSWQRISVPATECARIPAAFLEEERAALGDRWFRQEYLCEFVATEDTLFDRDLVEAAVTDDVKPFFG